MAAKKEQTIFQLDIALLEIRPLIWRRIQVSSEMTLPKVHLALQIVMGWENSHLHEFRVGGKTYAEADPEDHHFGRDVADQRRVRLGTLLSAVGSSFEYVYDFGDGWQHGILLEEILPVTPRKRYPVCLAGARSAPPEDVGGAKAYEHYLKALFDPKHKDHRTMLDWRGRFDPEYFPITSVNRALREAFPSVLRSPSVMVPKKSTAAPASVGLEQIFSSLIHSRRLPRKERISVGPGERIPLSLSARDRELLVEHSFAGLELTERLQLEPETDKPQMFYFTLDELDDLAGCVAAEANHAAKKAQPEWDVLQERVIAVLDQYTDEEPRLG